MNKKLSVIANCSNLMENAYCHIPINRRAEIEEGLRSLVEELYEVKDWCYRLDDGSIYTTLPLLSVVAGLGADDLSYHRRIILLGYSVFKWCCLKE